MHLNPENVTAILAEAAAAEILPRFRTLESHEVSEKESGELVTVADVAAEKLIAGRLLDLLPGSLVVGEEAVAEDARVMETLGGDDPVWVVDPVDGTANFAHGRPVFAVMAALVRGGEIVGGWIHDPIGGATGVAEAGGGAWLDGTRLRAATGGGLSEMIGTIHAGQFSTPEMTRHLQARRAALNTLKTLRCAGHEYLRLAKGETHFSLFTKLMPWDHAPGALLHREAGGVGRTLNGRTYDPRRRDGGALLLAPDDASWTALRNHLFGDTEFLSRLPETSPPGL